MKAHSVTSTQQPATPAASPATFHPEPSRGAPLGPPTFHVTAHGTVTARVFDLIYAHHDIRIVDVADAGAFLAPETALVLAALIAADKQLATLIQQQELGGAA